MPGFCSTSGRLTHSDKAGEVDCDENGIPFWKGKAAGYVVRNIEIKFIKPYLPKDYELRNCDFNVGSENFKNELRCEEAAKDKLCATLFWNMEQNNDKTKRIFNKWYQEKSDGSVDHVDFLWVYANIVKICSQDKYIYECKPKTHCKATICGKKYPNGGTGLGEEKLAKLVKCESYSGTAAYVSSRLPTTIHLCPVLFLKQVPELNKNPGLRSRLGTIFHEFSHFTYTMDNDDNTYNDKTILNEERVADNWFDDSMDNNAKTFDGFVEDLYHTSGVKTWADVAKLTGKTFSNSANENIINGQCKNSQWNKSNGADGLAIFLIVILVLFHF